MLKNFSLGMPKDWKADNTPLTITDTAINKLVIEEIEKKFPDHSIIGEEESALKDSEYAWVCDPVDGTIPFSHGYAGFVFSLALTKNGKSIAGVVYDPVLKRMFYGEKDKGAVLNNEAIRVSNRAEINNSLINLDTDQRLLGLRNLLIERGAYTTTFYGAVAPSALVACGEFVAEIFEYQNPWDAAAVKIIIEEAGGKVTDLFGNDQRYDQKINGFVASNGLVHEELLGLIKDTVSL